MSQLSGVSFHPELEGQVVVHHAVEQQVLTRYQGLFSEGEINSYENLRGIPNSINNDLHLSQIRREWNQFYRTSVGPTRGQLLDKATDIDTKFGDLFSQLVRVTPSQSASLATIYKG